MRVLPGVSITRVVHNVPGGRRAWTFPYFGIRAGRRWWWPLGFGSVKVDVRPDTSRFEAAIDRVKAVHHPRPVTVTHLCSKHSPPRRDRPGNEACPDCRTETQTACSNITCCGWPCPTVAALDHPTKETPDV